MKYINANEILPKPLIKNCKIMFKVDMSMYRLKRMNGKTGANSPVTVWSWIDGMKKYGRNIKTAYLWIF